MAPDAEPGRAEDLFAGHEVALAVLGVVREALVGLDVAERTTRSQVAFARTRGFAYLWRPGQYLHGQVPQVVLSIATPERINSPRFREVVQPSSRVWMHHLALDDVAAVDDEVRGWLLTAYAAADGG